MTKVIGSTVVVVLILSFTIFYIDSKRYNSIQEVQDDKLNKNIVKSKDDLEDNAQENEKNSVTGKNSNSVLSTGSTENMRVVKEPDIERESSIADETHAKKKHKKTDKRTCKTQSDNNDFYSSEKPHIVKSWLDEIGVFLPTFTGENKDTYLEQHPYSGYNDSLMMELAHQRDGLALHTIGLLKKFEAFHCPVPEKIIRVFDLTTFSISKDEDVDFERLAESNQFLMDAAAIGRVEALGDIAFNYFYLEQWAKANLKEESYIADIRLNKVAYSQVRQMIIPTLPTMFPRKELSQENLVNLEKKVNEIKQEYLTKIKEFNQEIPVPPQEFEEFMELSQLPNCD